MEARRTPKIWWYIFGLGCVLMVSVPVLRGWGVRGILWLSRPIVFVGQSVGERLHFSASNKQLQRDRDTLRQQVDDLTARLFDANQQLESLHVATELRTFEQTTHHTVLTANVIATSPDPGVQSIIIDRGSNDGLREQQVIITEAGYVVGKISSVHQNNSTVLLMTDGQSKISARLQNAAQSPGLVKGERGLTLQMDFIPKNDTVAKGQTVVTSGDESGVPPDLLVGTVTSVAAKAGELFQQALLTPSAPLQRLRVVAAIIS